MAINWHVFGSNDEDKADYSRGVLERFTRRAPNDWYIPSEHGKKDAQGNIHVKLILNPRRVDHFNNTPHCPLYIDDKYCVNENGNIVKGPFNNPVTAEKIVINHYHMKSKEEYETKISRGRPTMIVDTRQHYDVITDRNEEFDDWILKYRNEREKIYRPFDKSALVERVLTALMKSISPMLLPNTPQNFYAGKLETFLTFCAVSSWLKDKLADDTQSKFFEETALKAITKALSSELTLTDKVLFIKELPALLSLPYPIVKELRGGSLKIISELKEEFHSKDIWKDYIVMDYLKDILKG